MRRASLLLVLIIGLAGLAAAATSEEMFPQSVASGDPRATSVVLWTRVEPVPDDGPPSVPLVGGLEVATDPGFTDVVVSQSVTVDWERDGIVKVLVDGLEPYTTYYYRFSYNGVASQVGRTKTAPTADMDVPVRFAVVYCQDYIDRYYNAYLKLLRDHDEDIDFVIHLGDIIYEHTGGSSDVPAQTDRRIVFEDMEGTLPYGEFDAAGSLSNYRDIYRTLRSDPVYRQVHERWPMIVIWDDHEYSNDHWGATATYTNGRVDEYDPDRRRNAEQAFFEWVPIEVGLGSDGMLDINASILYPNTVIYRDFMFGSNLHLVMTDGRTFRPDHIVPEDAFPGAVAVDQQGLIELLGDLAFEQVRDTFDPYVNMDLLGAFVPILRQTATLIAAQVYAMENPALDLPTAIQVADHALSGNQSATIINQLFAAAGYAPPFTPAVLATLPRGLAYWMIGKSSFYAAAGVRFQVNHDAFNLLAAHRYLETMGEAQEVYGGLQTAWLQGALLQSPATWKVLSQSVMMTPLLVDFTNPLIAAQLPPGFPDLLRIRLGINVDDFNGFPQKRLEMLGLLSVVPNAVVISGDIHATYVTDHTNGVYEFTAPSISSTTFGEFIERGVAQDPILGQIPGIEEILQQIDLLLQVSTLDDSVTPSDIVYANNFAHGFMVMEATSETLRAIIYEIPSSEIHTRYYDDPAALDELFTVLPLTVTLDGTLIPGM
jgi:alkaline phosphatase D